MFSYTPSKYKKRNLKKLNKEEEKELYKLRMAWSDKNWKKWEKWSELREVIAWGICNKYKEED